MLVRIFDLFLGFWFLNDCVEKSVNFRVNVFVMWMMWKFYVFSGKFGSNGILMFVVLEIEILFRVII